MTLIMRSNQDFHETAPPPIPTRGRTASDTGTTTTSRPTTRRVQESKSFSQGHTVSHQISRVHQQSAPKLTSFGSTPKLPPRRSEAFDSFENPASNPPPIPGRTHRDVPPLPGQRLRSLSIDNGHAPAASASSPRRACPVSPDNKDLESRFLFHDISDLPTPEKFMNKRSLLAKQAAERRARQAVGSL